MMLNERVAIITGASRGIGEAIVQCFAAVGAKVVVNYRTGAGLAEDVVKENHATGGETTASVTFFRKYGFGRRNSHGESTSSR